MYLCHMVASSPNNRCYGDGTVSYLRTVVDLHVVGNNKQPLSFAVETREWVPFALF
jgi:hypothetical protein